MFVCFRERGAGRVREREASISCLTYAHHNLSVHETLNQWSHTAQGFPTAFIVMCFSLCFVVELIQETKELSERRHTLNSVPQVFSSASVHSLLYNVLFSNNLPLKCRQPCSITSAGLVTSRPRQQIKLELIKASQGQALGKDKMPKTKRRRKKAGSHFEQNKRNKLRVPCASDKMVGPVKIQDSRGSTIPDPQGSERGREAHRNTAVHGRIYNIWTNGREGSSKERR